MPGLSYALKISSLEIELELNISSFLRQHNSVLSDHGLPYCLVSFKVSPKGFPLKIRGVHALSCYMCGQEGTDAVQVSS